MNPDLRKWKKVKKRRDEILKSKHIKNLQREVITESDKSKGISHVLIMVGMVIPILGYILYVL